MGQAIDEHLERMAELDQADRRNGSYRRHLLTELGGIELSVPRTRRFAPTGVLRAYARRAEQLDRMILACFVLGLSVRKVAEALLPIHGRLISPATVSTVAKQLDVVVAVFHARPLKERYRVLMLDGVALGLRRDGKKEIIDFHLAQSESAAEWERFCGNLIRRGLVGEGLEMICVGSGSGLLAALPTAFPTIAVQRCWAHKMRNVLGKVRRADQAAVKTDLQAVINAKTVPQARSAARRFADRWEPDYPRAVACLRDDLDELLTPACAGAGSAGATNPSPSANGSGPPTPSSAACAKSGDEPGRWASSPTEPRWTASCSPSSTTKTKTRASAPLSC